MQTMRKQMIGAIACLAVSLSLASSTMAANNGDSFDVYVNGEAITATYGQQISGGTTYVCYLPVIQAVYPEATAVWKGGKVTITADGLTMTINPSAKYLECNGRCFYASTGFKMVNEALLVPAGVLAQALGGTAVWFDSTTLYITADDTPIASGDKTYSSDDLFWLSRIIFAESGNQSLEGKIAVGNVVLNRVGDSRFPNTVYDVIFQKNQFTPVANKSINRTPSEEAVAAAKLCLEGINTAGNSLYFVNSSVSPNSWASRARPYVATIGAHTFFA